MKMWEQTRGNGEKLTGLTNGGEKEIYSEISYIQTASMAGKKTWRHPQRYYYSNYGKKQGGLTYTVTPSAKDREKGQGGAGRGTTSRLGL